MGEDENRSCRWPTSIKEWFSYFRTGMTGHPAEDDICITIVCFPIKLPILLLGCLPCATYNSLRNTCAGTEKENYLC
jgi:hypothetical protein